MNQSVCVIRTRKENQSNIIATCGFEGILSETFIYPRRLNGFSGRSVVPTLEMMPLHCWRRLQSCKIMHPVSRAHGLRLSNPRHSLLCGSFTAQELCRAFYRTGTHHRMIEICLLALAKMLTPVSPLAKKGEVIIHCDATDLDLQQLQNNACRRTEQ